MVLALNERLGETQAQDGIGNTSHTEPVAFLNPTSRKIPATVHRKAAAAVAAAAPADSDPDAYSYAKPAADGPVEKAATTSGPAYYYLYRKRDNRKGRHAVVISRQGAAEQGVKHPAPTSSFKETMRGILKMLVRYPVFDVSYDTAVFFTLGKAN
jgi:hypothetical protein